METSQDIDKKLPLPSYPEDSFLDLKNEFAKIYSECGIDNFVDAADLGFLEINKPTHKLEVTPKGEKDILFEYGQSGSKDDQKENTSLVNKSRGMFSPGQFFASDVNFTTNGTLQTNSKHNIPQSPFANQAKTPDQRIDPGFAGIKGLFQSQEYIDAYEDQPLSLVWSNEPLKTAKQKLNISPDKHPTRVKREEYGSEYFSKPFGDEDIYHNYLAYENSQDNSRSEKDLSKFISIKREESEEGLSMMDPFGRANKSSSMRTLGSEKMLTKKNTWEAPSRKISDSIYDDDDKFDPNSDKARSSRGLRVLSLKVKDIVSEKKRTSYKEVAECLIDELGQNFKGKFQRESKDEQNVKRRVYDALNVLIAADILKKQGKGVFCDDKVANIGAHKRRNLKGEKEKLEIKLFEIKKRKKAKNDTLQELVQKCMAIKNLIQRNKEREQNNLAVRKLNMDYKEGQSQPGPPSINATQIGVDENNPSFKSKNEDVIAFPFIVLVSTSTENSMNLNMNSNQKKLSIESTSPFHIYGDIDILLKMKLHYVSQNFFRENIPIEIDKYISKSYLDSIK